MGLLEDLHSLAVRPLASARAERAQMAYDMYRGEQEPYIERNPDEDPREFARRPKEWLNVTRLVVDSLSGLYAAPARRTASIRRPSMCSGQTLTPGVGRFSVGRAGG